MQNKNSIVKVFTGNLLYDHPDKASIKAVDEALLRGMKRYLFSSSSVAADYAVTSRLHVFLPEAKNGRGDWIRTSDLYVPNVALQPD